MQLKVLAFVYSFIVCTGQLWAQKKNTTIIPEKTWLLRLNPLGLLDFNDHNISIGAEYRFKPAWSVSADIAYIFDASIEDLQRTRGYIFRPAVRKYYGRQLNSFFEAELHYKYVSYTMEGWVDRNVVNNTPAFEQYIRYHLIKKVVGLQVKAGAQEILVKDRLLIEIYAGVGIRAKWHDTDLPPNSNIRATRTLANDLDKKSSIAPAIPSGIRLLFRLP